MFDAILSSTAVKVIGLAIILASFIVLMKNPDRRLIDVLRGKKQSDQSKDSKETESELEIEADLQKNTEENSLKK